MTHHRNFGRGVLFFAFLMIGTYGHQVQAAQQGGEPSKPNPQNPTQPNPASGIETQDIAAPSATQPQPATLINETGSMPAEEVRALLTKVRFAEYHINDLLTDVHPERWKMSAPALDSYNQTLKTLRGQIASLSEWRAQFEQRTDSIFLGFQTYSAINAVLPRLNGVAQGIAQHEKSGYEAQFSETWDQLFDLQQTIGGYVGSLLQNQDQLLFSFKSNLATCQQSLSAAMRGKSSRATPVRNDHPIRPQQRSSHQAPGKQTGGGNQRKQETKPKENAAPLH